LSEEYEPHAIAAAALQMAYDQTRPAWMRSNHDPIEDAPPVDVPKPKPIKRVKPAESKGRVSPTRDR
jgi:ATP-dependent RNA helicase DeaD